MSTIEGFHCIALSKRVGMTTYIYRYLLLATCNGDALYVGDDTEGFSRGSGAPTDFSARGK